MSALHGVSGAPPAQVYSSSNPAAGAPPAVPPILPPPTGGEGSIDALSILFLVESKDRDLNLQRGKGDVTSAQKSQHDALAELEKAISDANEAAKHHSFWDDFGGVFATVAKVAAVVASVAAAVATAGAATPLAALAIAGACLSTAGFIQGEFHVLEKLGVSPEAAGWIGTGMSLGAGALATSGTAAAGAAETGGSATDGVAQVARGGATVVAGAATVTSGIAHIESGRFKAKQDHALADASMDDATWRMLQRRVAVLLDELRDSDQSSGRVLDRMGKTMIAKAETATMAVQWKG